MKNINTELNFAKHSFMPDLSSLSISLHLSLTTQTKQNSIIMSLNLWLYVLVLLSTPIALTFMMEKKGKKKEENGKKRTKHSQLRSSINYFIRHMHDNTHCWEKNLNYFFLNISSCSRTSYFILNEKEKNFLANFFFFSLFFFVNFNTQGRKRNEKRRQRRWHFIARIFILLLLLLLLLMMMMMMEGGTVEWGNNLEE